MADTPAEQGQTQELNLLQPKQTFSRIQGDAVLPKTLKHLLQTLRFGLLRLLGPYFNGLKRTAKALKRIDRCGQLYGDVAIMTADKLLLRPA